MRATVFLSVLFSTVALAGVIQPRQNEGSAASGDGQPTSQNAAGGGGGGTFQFAPACKASGSATPNPEDPMARAFLAYHNVHRTYQGACSLLWDSALAKQAQAAANTCKFQHQMVGDNGQNVAEGSASGNLAASTVSMWYEEGSKTNYQGGNMQQGHYTQVLWKSTSAVGCGFKNCGEMTLVFCDYAPAGNMMGAFKQNVGNRVAGARPICAEQQAMSQYANSGGGQGGSGGAGGKCITDQELGLPAGAGGSGGGGGSQGGGSQGGGSQGGGSQGGGSQGGGGEGGAGLKLGKGGLRGNSMGGGGGGSPFAQLMQGSGGDSTGGGGGSLFAQLLKGGGGESLGGGG